MCSLEVATTQGYSLSSTSTPTSTAPFEGYFAFFRYMEFSRTQAVGVGGGGKGGGHLPPAPVKKSGKL